MSFGKMNTVIELIDQQMTTDAEGFSVTSEILLAKVRAYREDRHGNTLWANRAVWIPPVGWGMPPACFMLKK